MVMNSDKGNLYSNINPDTEYTVKEACEFLEVGYQTVTGYLKNEKLKGAKRGPRNKWFVPGSEIIKLLNEWRFLKN